MAIADPQSEFLTIATAARLIGVSDTRAYALAAEGLFPVVRHGRRIRVPRAVFDAWLRAQADEAMTNVRARDAK